VGCVAMQWKRCLPRREKERERVPVTRTRQAHLVALIGGSYDEIVGVDVNGWGCMKVISRVPWQNFEQVKSWAWHR